MNCIKCDNENIKLIYSEDSRTYKTVEYEEYWGEIVTSEEVNGHCVYDYYCECCNSITEYSFHSFTEEDSYYCIDTEEYEESLKYLILRAAVDSICFGEERDPLGFGVDLSGIEAACKNNCIDLGTLRLLLDNESIVNTLAAYHGLFDYSNSMIDKLSSTVKELRDKYEPGATFGNVIDEDDIPF